MVLRMASTATSSALWRSPNPMVRAAAIAAFSTTRRNSKLSCASIALSVRPRARSRVVVFRWPILVQTTRPVEIAGLLRPPRLCFDRRAMAATPKDFRRLALALPESAERQHHNHPDFRVAGKIFATLGYPAAGWGMVRLTPVQQEEFVGRWPRAFSPAAGAWGRAGATCVLLAKAGQTALRQALLAAWRNYAPAELALPGRALPRRRRFS